MKKELKKKMIYASLFFILLILIFILFFPNFFLNEIIFPALSPFFPGFGPFNASITLKVNSAPLIVDFSNEIFVCENNATNYFFNVSDADRNLDSVSISPTSPFFVQIVSSPSQGESLYGARIFSAILDKTRVNRSIGYRTYERTVFALDDEFSDTKGIYITVIEINNPPLLDNIGVQTVWTRGEDSIFYHQAGVNDIEDGNQNSGNLSFNITFLNGARKLFNISNNGTMYYIGNESDLGIYNISVCTTDLGLRAIHQNISLCGQDGKNITRCVVFSLTVTNNNRAPNITSHFPFNLSLNTFGTDALYFNITTKDPDGTIPDAYWYVDNRFFEYDNNSLFDEFRYSFGCGVGGNHSVRVDVTDGLLNDSLQWNIGVGSVSCPAGGGSSGGGGGGGSFSRCKEDWGCLDWNVCQNANQSFLAGVLSADDFKTIKDRCKSDFFGDNCGLQIRGCFDVNSCNTTVLKPEEIGHCYYTRDPSCLDGIKNCHDSSCELLVDCGGPCNACSTCSDGIKNQGEIKIDCGGPCPGICPLGQPIFERKIVRYSLLIFVLLLLIVIIIQLIRIYRARRKMQNLGVYGNSN